MPTPSPASRPLVLIAVLVLVAGVTATVHWPVLSAQALSLDDAQFLTENELIQNPGWESAQRFFGEVLEPSTVGGYYLPLAMNSLMLDYALGGRPDDLTVFHRTSLILHVLNTCLVVVLLWLLFGNLWVGALIGMLFGAHPLTVEPMIWVGERKTLLATLFAFVGLVLYVRHVGGRGRRYLVGAVVAYALSLLSKPTATALPLLLVLLDVWPLRRFGRPALLEKIPFLVVGAVSAAITLISHSRSAELGLAEDPSPIQVVLMASRNLVFYLGKIVWPGELSSYYYIAEPLRIGDPAVLAGVIGVVVLGAAAALTFRRTPALFVGLGIFALGLAPTLGFVRYSWVLVSDKYVYFPVVGLLILLAWGLVGLLRRSPGWMRVVLGLVVVVLVVGEARGVRAYQEKWSDSETLFRHMVETAPQAARAHDMYGNVLLEQGRTEEAVAEYERAAALDPGYSSAWSNLGTVRFAAGDLPGAMVLWRRAVAADERSADALTNLAIGLARRGEMEAAIDTFGVALRLKPKHPYALNNLGMELYRLGRVGEATALFARAVKHKTNYADARVNLGIALSAQGRPREAVAQFQAALEYGANPGQVNASLAGALLQADRIPEAAVVFEEAIRAQPRDPRLRNNYALVLSRMGRTEDALGQARAAVQLDSTYVDARLNTGFLLETTGDVEGARAQYEAILGLQPDHVPARERLNRLGRP